MAGALFLRLGAGHEMLGLEMETSFQYQVLSSVLHDEGAVAKAVSPFESILQVAGGAALEGDDRNHRLPLLLLVATGGTEAQALKLLLGEDDEASALLAAIPDNNSLPACLEILARVRQEGGRGRILFLESSAGSGGAEQVKESVLLERVRLKLADSRIGVVGDPSDWLVASSHDGEIVRRSWGLELVPVPLATLRARLDGEGRDSELATDTLDRAAGRVEPEIGDIDTATRVYLALRWLTHDLGLDALTLRCFDLVLEERTTGCLALSELADGGLPAGCEGDVPSVINLLWLHTLTGNPAWMANPARIDAEKGEMVLAHCTVPRSMVQSYRIRSHFESGLGVALAGDLEAGPVTLVRIGGSDLREIWLAEADLVASGREERLCRTQATVRLDPQQAAELLSHPLGNHLVLVRGHLGGLLRSSHELIMGA